MSGLNIKKIVDLTHTLTPENPTWDGECGFDLKTTLDHLGCTGKTKFKLQSLQLKKTGTGTHIDAPLHCFPGQAPVASLSLEQLIVKAYVIDVSVKATAEYLLSVDDIISFEKSHGIIEKDSLVIIYTGWDRFWSDAKKYRNENAQGVMQFPSISAEAAQYLIDRDIAGVAIDTLSPDCPAIDYPVHRLMLAQDKYVIENIAHCDQLPPTNAYVIALPLKINAPEAPVRVVGLIMEN